MLSTTKKVKPIEKKKFAVAALNPDYEVFLVYIAIFNISSDTAKEVHRSKRAQIAHLKADEAPIKVPYKYIDFAKIFLPKLAIKLSKHINIYNYAIELVSD